MRSPTRTSLEKAVGNFLQIIGGMRCCDSFAGARLGM